MTGDAALLLVLATRELILLAGIGLLISGLDDLAVDMAWLAGRPGARRHGAVAAEDLVTAAPGRFAVLVPAWDEGELVGAMLRRLLATQDHPGLAVFAGVYPNDPATHAAVAALEDPRLRIVVTPRPGPTSKADCLNALWRAALAHEAQTGARFKAMVLHDAEDVVHPLELRVFDALIPRLGLVQLPVVPLADPDSRWVAGHYLDEFAESHGKDLVVREGMGAGLPSAGVATAIERTLLGRIARARGGEPFDPTCLTEDYELGLAAARMGARGALVRVRDRSGALVATREHFPAGFAAAVRQKSRWLAGIALAGWERTGWAPGAAEAWWRWRDRKPVLGAPLTLMAWVALALGLAIAAARAAWPQAWAGVPALVREGSALAWLLATNGALMAWRLAVRAAFTAREHGWREGLRAVPRALVANAINIAAMARAWRRWAAARARGGPPAWEKTAHRFPGLAPGGPGRVGTRQAGATGSSLGPGGRGTGGAASQPGAIGGLGAAMAQADERRPAYWGGSRNMLHQERATCRGPAPRGAGAASAGVAP
jgi:adsorption protein B